MATKFFYCPHCGNVVVKFLDSGVTPYCCGSEMVELQPGTSDGSGEKHLPVVKCMSAGRVRVEVGSQPHPMLPEHHIELVVLETDRGLHLRRLRPHTLAVAEFCVGSEKPVAVYEYCNVHGLWKTDVEPSKCCCNAL